MLTHREFAKTDQRFREAFAVAFPSAHEDFPPNVPTKRQASKYRRGFGATFKARQRGAGQ